MTIGLAQDLFGIGDGPARLSPEPGHAPTYWDAFPVVGAVLPPPIRPIMACRVLTILLELATGPIGFRCVFARASVNPATPPVAGPVTVLFEQVVAVELAAHFTS